MAMLRQLPLSYFQPASAWWAVLTLYRRFNSFTSTVTAYQMIALVETAKATIAALIPSNG
jgi:hypothetical protein